MIFRPTYLFLLSIFFVIAGTDTSLARQTLGVVWDTPESEAEILRHLDRFTELGIEVLELEHPVENNFLNLVSEYNFSLMMRTPEKFYTLSEIKRQQQNLLQRYREITQNYSTIFNVNAIGLISNSQLYRPDYLVEFLPMVDTLELSANKEFYYVQNEEWFYFDSPLKPFARLINGQSFTLKDINQLNSHLSDSVFVEPRHIIFMHSSWLFDGIKTYPELRNSLVEYKKSGEWLLPLAHAKENPVTPNWPVLLLLILWTGFAVQLRYVPVSGPLIARYFLAHRFFADDILHYRERSATGGINVMILHSLFGGLVFYLLALTFISETGLEALFDHLPALAITGSNYFSFFALAVILITLMQFLSLFWLYLPNRSLSHFSQVINLYSGIFYIDFMLVTIMLTLFLSGASSTVILVLGILFVFFWFSAFYIAAGDSSKYMGPGKVIYLLITIGLHTALTAALVILIFMNPHLLEVFELVVRL